MSIGTTAAVPMGNATAKPTCFMRGDCPLGSRPAAQDVKADGRFGTNMGASAVWASARVSLGGCSKRLAAAPCSRIRYPGEVGEFLSASWTVGEGPVSGERVRPSDSPKECFVERSGAAPTSDVTRNSRDPRVPATKRRACRCCRPPRLNICCKTHSSRSRRSADVSTTMVPHPENRDISGADEHAPPLGPPVTARKVPAIHAEMSSMRLDERGRNSNLIEVGRESSRLTPHRRSPGRNPGPDSGTNERTRPSFPVASDQRWRRTPFSHISLGPSAPTSGSHLQSRPESRTLKTTESWERTCSLCLLD
jgi:hypothetical protein